VRALMQGQHKVMIRDLMQGKLDERIIAFFASRGEHIGPAAEGAVPAAPLLETSAPAMVLAPTAPPIEVTAAAPVDSVAAPAAEAVPVLPQVPATPEREPSGGVPVRVGPRRSSTRPIDTSRKGAGGNPSQVVVRAADGRRPPFVRNGSGPVAKMSSADGVVVQRSVVVGDAAAPSRPARIRPPVPYVVTGGNHTERPPRPADPSATTQPLPSPVVPVAASPAPAGAPTAPVDPHRGATGAFGVGLSDDKSLDEVILEYLSEDGE